MNVRKSIEHRSIFKHRNKPAATPPEQIYFLLFIFRVEFEQIHSGKVETNSLQRGRKCIRTKLLKVIFKFLVSIIRNRTF